MKTEELILMKSIEHEQLKNAFESMFMIVADSLMNEDNMQIDLCEDFLKAEKVYNQITGRKHVTRHVEDFVNKHYNIP